MGSSAVCWRRTFFGANLSTSLGTSIVLSQIVPMRAFWRPILKNTCPTVPRSRGIDSNPCSMGMRMPKSRRSRRATDRLSPGKLPRAAIVACGGELSSMRQGDTPAYYEICWLWENVARGHTLLGGTGISGLYPLMGMRAALTGPHLEQANVRHSTSLRVACGSTRLRYVDAKQTGHRPTVMTDIASLHKGIQAHRIVDPSK
jgi:hypothetical protein